MSALLLLLTIGEAKGTELLSNDLDCLATNAYFEANTQSLAGQIAIVLVVLNRVKSEKFPNTICEVVLEGPVKESWKTRKDKTLTDDERIFYPVKNRCQFSWYCDGVKDVINNREIWLDIKIHIEEFLDTERYDFTEGSIHYHAYYVSPEWADEKKLTTIIGDHLFYR